MNVAENFEQPVERVMEAATPNSTAGQVLAEGHLQMKLAQNPNMTAEESAQTKSESIGFLFSALLKEGPELMKEQGVYVWNALRKAL